MTAEGLLSLASSGAPLDEQRLALATALAERGVGADTVARLMERTRDGIVLHGTDERRRSRIGGDGLLPVGEQWPLDVNGSPFTFLAAVDLAEVPSMAPLPDSGTLLIYWDFLFVGAGVVLVDFVATTRVYWVPCGDEMRELPQPGAEWELDELSLAGVAMPVAGEQQKVDLAIGDAPDREALFDAMNELAPVLYRHQLLGASRDLQGPVLDSIPYWLEQSLPETRALYSPRERTGAGWILLAQIEEDPGVPNLGIGDAGILYFVMPELDLLARRFDRVMGIMQCH
jgi:hypothetical protein